MVARSFKVSPTLFQFFVGQFGFLKCIKSRSQPMEEAGLILWREFQCFRLEFDDAHGLIMTGVPLKASRGIRPNQRNPKPVINQLTFAFFFDF